MATGARSNPRFATINEQELQELINNKDAANTKRSTETSVAIFREYLQLKGYPVEFEEYEKDRLASVLKYYYADVRREDGHYYKTGSLKNLRSGLMRHLKNSGKNIDILNSSTKNLVNMLRYCYALENNLLLELLTLKFVDF